MSIIHGFTSSCLDASYKPVKIFVGLASLATLVIGVLCLVSIYHPAFTKFDWASKQVAFSMAAGGLVVSIAFAALYYISKKRIEAEANAPYQPTPSACKPTLLPLASAAPPQVIFPQPL
jgi:hypothetical protein